MFGGRILSNYKKLIFFQVRQNGTWLLEQLKERTILKLKGDNCNEFLQGLITNDVKLLNKQKSVYALFLNSKGRILYDSIIYKTDCEDTVLIECDVACMRNLEQHLNLYKVRRKVEISCGEYFVWAAFNSNFNSECDFNLELNEKCILSPDPRLSELGFRAIVTHDTILTTNSLESTYKMHRYKLGIAEGANELLIGKSFPLESNCDYLNGVSFNKGCYIGQEVTARTYHTGVVRKRLMPLSFFKVPQDISLDDSVLESDSSKSTSVGKLRGICGNLGIGLMRVSEVLFSSNLKVADISLKCSKPSWWPKESEQYKLKKLS